MSNKSDEILPHCQIQSLSAGCVEHRADSPAPVFIMLLCAFVLRMTANTISRQFKNSSCQLPTGKISILAIRKAFWERVSIYVASDT